ncbi:hypothetical protein SBA3_240012 [Candidatus Sulfopaludibacter sp. SbA3]|nr:hypothetical protein SBA3_240012 [Candidatus Sulfopaludibacter sp. SbA3]
MGFRLAQPAALWLLLLLPGVAALFRYGDRRRRAALLRFSQAADSRGQVDHRKRRRKRGALVGAVALLILALARPVWMAGPGEPPPNTSDVVFLLDVSRSMLAGDAKPTRLEHAKGIIADLVKQFQTERVALVTFAGNCAVQCPLTIDYNYFRDRLEAADTETVTRGGTRIGDAIAFALNTAFDDVQRGRKQLVLLTDGGDQDSSPGAGAQLATAHKVRVIAIGIGNDQVGATVPVSATDRSPFLYKGHPVITRLESAGMESMASLNLGGMYLHAGTDAIDAGQVYRQLLAASSPLAGGAPRKESDGYPFLLALALTLLLGESLISDRKLQSAGLALFLALAPAGKSLQVSEPLPRGTLSQVPSEPGVADDTGSIMDLVRRGNESFARRSYANAVRSYLLAADSAPNSPEVLFNLALAFYKTEGYAEAASTFGRAATHSRDPKFRAQCKFGQANASYRIAMQRSGNLFEFEQALSLTIPIYRDALALDPGLTDCKYNIEVIKRKLRELAGPMRAATNRFMVQSREDMARRQNTEASQILQENKNSKKTKGQVGRPAIDTDW